MCIRDRPKLTAGFENVYVYCDVLEHVLVGDTKTPLLRVLHRKGSDYSSEHVVFNPVQYMPLQKKCFDTIGMHLMNDGGRSSEANRSQFCNLVRLHIHIFCYKNALPSSFPISIDNDDDRRWR